MNIKPVEMEKVFTFLIKYNGDDYFGEITFCAKNKDEALDLYKNWEKEDHPGKTYPVANIEPIYLLEDSIAAQENGQIYGIPGKYDE